VIKVDGYPMDATISEAPSFESEISDHPIESGSDVSDNIRPKPVSLEVECIVSDTPLGTIASDPTRLGTTANPKPSKDAYDRLFAIWANKKLVTVECYFGTFTNMALEKFAPKRDDKTGNSLQYSGTFRKIDFVTVNRTTVLMAIPSGGAKKDLGNLTSPVQQLLSTVAPIYVIQRSPTQYASIHKSFGEPIWRQQLFTDSGGGIVHDYYDVKGTATKPDGWLTGQPNQNTNEPYIYHPGGAGTTATTGFSSTNLNPTINDQPVHYDYNQKSWNRDSDDKPLTHVPPDEDKWSYVTTHRNPK
jgi:hypothetical protein